MAGVRIVSSLPRLLACRTAFTFVKCRHLTSSEAMAQEVVHESRIDVPLDPKHNVTISVINFNDSQHRNALSRKLVYKTLEILDRLRLEQLENDRIRALILRSNVPGVFCAGANLKERQLMSNVQVESWLRVQRLLMDSISDFPYPTIAAIDGHALGGGFELALACDMRVVNEKVKLGLVETSWAIIPGAGGTQRLARLIGIEAAKDHIFRAEPVSGAEAKELGMARYLVSGEGAAFAKAVEIAKKICKRGPKALRLAKAAIDNGTQTSLDTGLDIEHAYYVQLLGTADRDEGMKAFVEKREPVYKGE